MGTLAAALAWLRSLHARSAAERAEYAVLPGVYRGVLLGALLGVVATLLAMPARVLPAVAALAVLCAASVVIPPVPSPTGQTRIPRLAFTTTLALLWPPEQVLVASASGVLLGALGLRLYEPWRALANATYWAYPAALASCVSGLTSLRIHDPFLTVTAAALAAVAIIWVGNFSLLAVARYLRTGAPIGPYLRRCLSEDPLGVFVAVPFPIFLTAMAQHGPSTPVERVGLTGFMLLTMFPARMQLVAYFALGQTADEIVRALMIGMDRILPGAAAHAERVTTLVAETGGRLRISGSALETWMTAARLHDIGLINPEVRSAPPEAHADASADILAGYPEPAIASIVREHHTPHSRWRLTRGRAAALGAKVLAAAEYYDEVRYGGSGRALTHEETAAAVQRLVATQLDPTVTPVVLAAAGAIDARP